MKTIGELLDYYRTTLVSDLEVLEKQRVETRNKIIFSASIIIPLGILLTFLIGFFALFLGIFILSVIVVIVSRRYISNFKANVIDKLVKFLDKDLAYSQNGYIPQEIFLESSIFKQGIDRYSGDDYVKGKIDQTQIKFSEIHAQYTTRDSKGRTQHHTIFKGLFCVADFNKEFKGKTVVLPDTAERLFGGLGTALQSWNTLRGELVKLEDPEFEKSFVVYADDQIEARYILSTSLMKRIVDFKKKTKRKIYLSFVKSKIFVAIAYTRNLFEPRIFKTLLDFSPILQYYEDLKLAIDLVEDLNLNTRIWSKN